MKTTDPKSPGRWKIPRMGKVAVLACALGVATWLLLSVVVPPGVPGDFPTLPDLQSGNATLRALVGAADAQARSHPDSAQDVGRLGMVYHANQFIEQAQAAYTIAARLAPRDYRWPYCLALIKEESGREREVPDLLLTSVKYKDDFLPSLLKLGDYCFKQENPGEAARYYEASLRASDKDSRLQALFGLARVAARRQEWNKVIEYAAPLPREYPHVRSPHQLLLAAYEALGQADRAAEERKVLLEPKLIVVPPVRDVISEELGTLCCSSTRLLKAAGLLCRFGRPDDAIDVARRVVEIEPGDADAHHFLARTLLETHGDNPSAVDEALAQLKEGMRLRPDDLTPLWFFASFFFENRKTETAVEQLHSLLAENAGREDAHYYLGLVADHQGRVQQAVAQYQAALKSNPSHALACNKLGLILVTQGRLDESIAYFRRALGLDPTFTLARCNLGVALEQKGRIDEAIEQFVETLRLKPSDGPTHLYLAIALLKTGKIEEAIPHFREAARITPDDPQAHYGLGGALAMHGNPQEAVGEVREALRLRPDYAEARALLQKLEQGAR